MSVIKYKKNGTWHELPYGEYDIPTKVSDLENDLGFLTAEDAPSNGISREEMEAYVDETVNNIKPPEVNETDPTVPDWAKQPQKPTYTAAEVGAVSPAYVHDAIDEAIANLPTGGGDKWEDIIDFTVEQDVTVLTFDKDINGNPFALKELKVFVIHEPLIGSTANVVCRLGINYVDWGNHAPGSVTLSSSPKESEKTTYSFVHIATCDGVMQKILAVSSDNFSSATHNLGEKKDARALYVDTNKKELKTQAMPCTKFGIFGLASSGPCFAKGSRIIARGVRA